MTTLKVLEKARELIADPSHWTKGDLAKDADGKSVDIYGPEATCFCSLGAIIKAYRECNSPEGSFARAKLSQALRTMYPSPAPSIAEFNDNAEHSSVMAMFDKAIELAKADRNADQS